MRGPILFGIALSLTAVAGCTPIQVTGAFHNGGWWSWGFQGAGISFQTVQGQTSYNMTTCYSGQPCAIDGAFGTFWGDQGSANLSYAGLQLTSGYVSGRFNWSAAPLVLPASDIQGPPFHVRVPVLVDGRVQAFQDLAHTMPLADFALTGSGFLELTDLWGAITPGQMVVVVGDGVFSGDAEAVPEPACAVLLATGVLIGAAVRRRRLTR